MSKVEHISDERIEFDDGKIISYYHDQDCCEDHYLDFEDLTLDDFKGLDFDLLSDNFFERVENYGIKLIPINGHPVRIPGYGENNGYYSENINLLLQDYNGRRTVKEYNITECQKVNYHD